MRPLASHLQASRARRFAAVRHLADLFDRYALQRPELIQAWAGRRGRALAAGAVAAPERAPGRARPGLPRGGRVRAPARRAGPRGPAAALLAVRPHAAPGRPAARAGGARRSIATCGSSCCTRRPRCGAGSRAPRASRAAPRTPRSRRPRTGCWARGGTTRASSSSCSARTSAPPSIRSSTPTGSLLARLQAGVREDTAPPGAPHPGHADARPPLDPSDRSVEVHACHGRARQVEVLRDAILHAMEEDAALEPRDVIVMCPDIEVFAPLIQATFGAGDIVVEGDPELAGLPDLRVRLADRSLRQTNPVLGVVARLLELAEERLTASQVIDFADREPVRRRFRLDDDALTRVEEWIADSGIRWGLDAGHRAPFKLEKLDSGTWRKGLDRLLLGVTMSEQDQRLFADVLPLDDVESGSIDLAGRFSELVERLGVAIDALSVLADRAGVGGGDRGGRRRADGHQRARQLAARRAAAAAGRRRARGGGPRRHARAGRDPRAAGRAPAGPADARELPHRPPDDLHARADALGAAPGRVPARPGRRRVPAQGPARRRRPAAQRPARRRPGLAHGGPPDAARRADGGDGPADHHLHRQRRAHEHRAPARGAGRGAAGHGGPHRARRRPARPRPRAGQAPAAAVRSAQLRARPARRRQAVELRPRDAGGRPRAGDGPPEAARVPGRAAARLAGRPCSSSRTWRGSSPTRSARSWASGWR